VAPAEGSIAVGQSSLVSRCWSVAGAREGQGERTAVVELPGRHFDAISPERAADILLESAGAQKEHDVWTLIEPLEAQRAITQHMIQERRRVRRE